MSITEFKFMRHNLDRSKKIKTLRAVTENGINIIIPEDPRNRHYKMFKRYLRENNMSEDDIEIEDEN